MCDHPASKLTLDDIQISYDGGIIGLDVNLNIVAREIHHRYIVKMTCDCGEVIRFEKSAKVTDGDWSKVVLTR